VQELCEHPVDQRQRHRWIIRGTFGHESAARQPRPRFRASARSSGGRPAGRAGAASDCWRTQPQQQQPQQPSGPGRAIDERTRARHAAVHQLLGQGVGLLDCARRLGWALNTVKRYARAATAE
jgi:DNA-binding NarL/FixJ family response regulator